LRGNRLSKIVKFHLILTALAAATLAVGFPLSAQEYPAKPVRILVGFAPGGGTDIVARAIAPRLTAALGQPAIVENRPGAGSNIATEIVARAAPDGYTLLMGTIAALAINPSLYGKLPFDPVRDFAPITQAGSMNNIIVVHPVLPVTTLKEFVALAKSRPGQISYATPGAGSSAHLAGDLFRKVAGIDIVPVPYKGGGQAIVDTLAGHVPAFFASVPVVIPHVKAGKLRAIAVTTGKRATAMPDVPTVAEAGYTGYEVNNWYGLLAPAGTPRPVIDRLNKDVTAVLKSPDVTKFLSDHGHDAVTTSPEQFGAYIKSELTRWARIVKDAGAKAN
jgi:tripartite-type tricarboxylate transporter receptor subunit TctC